MIRVGPYVRKGIYYNIAEFLSKVEIHHTKKDLIIWDGDEIKLGSDRYKIFKTNGIKCKCGVEGKLFAPGWEKRAGINWGRVMFVAMLFSGIFMMVAVGIAIESSR